MVFCKTRAKPVSYFLIAICSFSIYCEKQKIYFTKFKLLYTDVEKWASTMKNKFYYQSPIGALLIEGDDETITGLYFGDEGLQNEGVFTLEMDKCINQLNEYFEGNRKVFSLNLNLQGTDFQKSVWNALLNIPYGNTASYSDIAKAVNSPKAVRAVGGANHRNPVSIIVPCHRVIGSNGSLTGYGGELWRKEFLLNLEKNNK